MRMTNADCRMVGPATAMPRSQQRALPPRALLGVMLLALLLAVGGGRRQVAGVTRGPAALAVHAAAARSQAQAAYGKLPLSFELNQGQSGASVDFLARGSGYSLALSGGEMSLALSAGHGARDAGHGVDDTFGGSPTGASALQMHLLGAQPDPAAIGVDLLPGAVNYFIGSDASQWRTGVPAYAKVRYQNVYPGIDLVYYGNQGQVEYDFIVSPGADANQIALAYAGAESLRLDEQGNLLVGLSSAGPYRSPALRQGKPTIYQEIHGERRTVDGGYRLQDGTVQFALESYDTSLPLVIDPTLVYSTYLGGGSFDSGYGIAVDGNGSAYVTGQTAALNFPTCPGSDLRCASTGTPLQATRKGPRSAFVAKLSADGTHLLYSTYIGGSGTDSGYGIAVDSAGDAVITGNTTSSDFPTTQGALQRAYGGNGNAFVAKLSPDGTKLLYSTYLGSSGGDAGDGIGLDTSGNAYLIGETSSTNFPTCPGSDPRCASAGTALQTALGPQGDVFVAKLNADGSRLLYSTLLGGSGRNDGLHIAVDAGGGAYIVGETTSTDFPTCPGADARCAGSGIALQPAYGGGRFDAYVAKLTPDGTKLAYSTYLGGNDSDGGGGIAVDSNGSAYVSGYTPSTNFPTCPGADPRCASRGTALKTSLGSVADNSFVAKLSADGTRLLYSTYLGGTGTGDDDEAYTMAIDGSGNAYVSGFTSSTDFPTTANAVQRSYGGGATDAFVAKLNATGSALLYASYLGGSDDDDGEGGVAVDTSGNVYLTGDTTSTNFPTCPGPDPRCISSGSPLQASLGGSRAAFVAKIVTRLRGDVNQTGRVDAVDALCILRSVAGLATTPACSFLPAGVSDPIWHV
ncbi:MAG: SBBP repeat-containing protein, partial [Dehalococcoidia bacterium]